MSYYSSNYGSYGSSNYGSYGQQSRTSSTYGRSDSYNSRNDFEKSKKELEAKKLENKKDAILKKSEYLISQFFEIIKLIEIKIVSDIISKLKKIGNKPIVKYDIEETNIMETLKENFSTELEKIQTLFKMIDNKYIENIKTQIKRKFQGHSSGYSGYSGYSRGYGGRDSNSGNFKSKIVKFILEGNSEEIIKILLEQVKKLLATKLSSNRLIKIFETKINYI